MRQRLDFMVGVVAAFLLITSAMLAVGVTYLRDIRDGVCHGMGADRGPTPLTVAWRTRIERAGR